jgi:acyl-CoA synthetase (AMP-forming)/AMP-acid ligase II
MSAVDASPGAPSFNIARLLEQQAAERPRQRAVVYPEKRDRFGNMAWTHLSFDELNRLSDEYARGMVQRGVKQGDRVSLLVKPCLEFIPLVFAIFKIGALPVLIDPGMGREGFLACIQRIRPRVLIGEPLAQLIRLVFRSAFESVEISITNGTHTGIWGGVTIDGLRVPGAFPFPTASCAFDDEAAILFTSGSTGPAKGVTYTHGIFDAQTRHIQSMYGIEAGEVDLACFPLFGLFSMAMGMTVVIPEMDPTKPAQADPKKLVEAIEAHGCTSAFGSPAIWKNLALWGKESGLKLPTMKRILMAGAPVPVWMHEAFQRIFDSSDGSGTGATAELHTPYGATESLPVATIGSHTILRETAQLTRHGKGVCVGHVAPGMQISVIRIEDGPIAEWSDELLVAPGEIGEFVADGEVVTQEYKDEPDHTAKAKIRKGERMVHRMGDVGYVDAEGRLWFCGRKSHIVTCADGTRMFPVPCEAIFNEHKDVYRTALVGVGGAPGLVVELEPGTRRSQAEVKAELLEIAKGSSLVERVERIWFHDGFPVDVRHNAKIHRGQLATWAAATPPA